MPLKASCRNALAVFICQGLYMSCEENSIQLPPIPGLSDIVQLPAIPRPLCRSECLVARRECAELLMSPLGPALSEALNCSMLPEGEFPLGVNPFNGEQIMSNCSGAQLSEHIKNNQSLICPRPLVEPDDPSDKDVPWIPGTGCSVPCPPPVCF